MPGEAADVHLVDDRLGEWPAERRVAFPVVPVGIGHDAFHGGSGVRARTRSRRARSYASGHRDGEAVGIEKHLLRIEAQAAFGRERSVSAIGVHLTRRETGHEGVPVVIGAMCSAAQAGSLLPVRSRSHRRTAAGRCASRLSRTR